MPLRVAYRDKEVLPGVRISKRNCQEFHVMACLSCGSETLAEFGAEMNIHFPGLKGLNKAGVLVFAKLRVCFDCGSTLFALPENELRLLEKDGAA
jgi:hypothetical protein